MVLWENCWIAGHARQRAEQRHDDAQRGDGLGPDLVHQQLDDRLWR